VYGVCVVCECVYGVCVYDVCLYVCLCVWCVCGVCECVYGVCVYDVFVFVCCVRLYVLCVCVCVLLEIEPRALHTLVKFCTSPKPHTWPFCLYLFLIRFCLFVWV
jgi:hypothetical protein